MQHISAKMAEGISYCGGHSSILSENEVNMENCACYKCSNYKEKLKIVSDELKSAEIIIQILQQELQSIRAIENSCVGSQIATEGSDKTPITKEWALITSKTSKNNFRKMSTHDGRNKTEITTTDQPITPANRFIALHNLEENIAEPIGYQTCGKQSQMHEIHKSIEQ